MRLRSRWSLILIMGLLMALSPLSAQAGPNRPFAPQPNHHAVTPDQPRGIAHGWNDQHREWRQPRGNATGWHGQNRQGRHYRNAYGRNDHRRQWRHHRNPYGRNDHQRQWQQPRPSSAQGDRPVNRLQAPNRGQQNNPRSSYNRASYPEQAQSPNIAPSSSGYSHNTSVPAGHFRRPETSGNTP
jgi:hypothetical protein